MATIPPTGSGSTITRRALSATVPVGSVGFKLAVGTFVVVTLVSAGVYFALSAHQQQSLFSSKELAATMVTKLFASSVAAAVQFEDQQGLSDSLAQLRQNPDVDATTVFKVAPSGAAERLGGFAPKGAPQGARLNLSEIVKDPLGVPIGRVDTVFSLSREEAIFARLKKNILLTAAATALLLIVVLMVMARRIVVRPLERLSQAARALEAGERIELGLKTQDEVGALAVAFSSMADVIQDRETRIARRNRDLRLVLDNVGQGFFAVDADGKLVGERSAILATWLGMPDRGEHLWSYLGRVDAKKAPWIQAMWSTLKDDFLPIELAVQQIPSRLSDGSRHFDIMYRPIVEDGIFRQCVIVLTDVTSVVVTELAEREQRQRLEIWKRYMASRSVFLDFLTEGTDLVDRVTAGIDRDKEAILRALHTLKGNAASFAISGVAEFCHTLESRMLDDADLPTPEERAELRALWAAVQHAVEQMAGTVAVDSIAVSGEEYEAFRTALADDVPRDRLISEVDRWRFVPTAERLNALADAARALALRLGKGPIEVTTQDNGVRLPVQGWSSFWTGLIHVVRNAVDHGLESTVERTALGKVARVTISTAYHGENVVVTVEDTGRGIDWDKVAERARALGLPWETRAQLSEALFADGLTTRQEATDVSGRGVGLAAVRESVLRAGGRIVIESQDGVGSRFVFAFPAPIPPPFGKQRGCIVSHRAAVQGGQDIFFPFVEDRVVADKTIAGDGIVDET